jgi:hypothetical protein
MKKLFYSASEFAAMQQRAEKAEATVNAVAAHFGEEANAEGFVLADAVASLGTVEETETKPNARLVALATKYSVEVAGDGDDAVIDALEERMETYAGVTVPPASPKSKEEKIEADPKANYTLTPFEASVRAEAEKEAKFDNPVLD